MYDKLAIISLIVSAVAVIIVFACVGRIRELGIQLNYVKQNYDSFLQSLNSYNNALKIMESDFDSYKDRQAQREIRLDNDIVVRVKKLEEMTKKE